MMRADVSFRSADIIGAMAGLTQHTPVPTAITLHRKSRQVEIAFDDGCRFLLPFEFLRVYSPSAEVRGHGPGQEVLQLGKRNVEVTDLQPVGHYAVRPVFSDGHDSGLYSWDYLYMLGRDYDALWQQYLVRLEQTGGSRDQDSTPSTVPGHGGSGRKCQS